MKSCAQCNGKLGLGVRARNLWNGRWWIIHVRFCSTHCEAATRGCAGAPSWVASTLSKTVPPRKGSSMQSNIAWAKAADFASRADEAFDDNARHMLN